jgi:hypothetical protein
VGVMAKSGSRSVTWVLAAKEGSMWWTSHHQMGGGEGCISRSGQLPDHKD